MEIGTARYSVLCLHCICSTYHATRTGVRQPKCMKRSESQCLSGATQSSAKHKPSLTLTSRLNLRITSPRAVIQAGERWSPPAQPALPPISHHLDTAVDWDVSLELRFQQKLLGFLQSRKVVGGLMQHDFPAYAMAIFGSV